MNTPVACENPNAGIESQTGGNAKLRLFPDRLFYEFLPRFARAAVSIVCQGLPIPDPQQLLNECGLDPRTVGLKDWCDPTAENNRYLWHGSVGELARLRGEAEQLVSSDGSWKSELTDLQHEHDEQLQRFEGRIEKLFETVLRRFGLRGVEVVWNLLFDQLQSVLAEVREDSRPVTAREEADVERQARRLVRNSREYWLARLLGRFFPDFSGRWLLGEDCCDETDRAVESMCRLYRRRRHLALNEEKVRLLEALVGTDSSPGLLGRMQTQWQQHDLALSALQERLTQDPADSDSCGPTDIRLVDSIDDVIDQNSGQTLLECAFAVSQRAGCTPEELAREFMLNGLSMGSRAVRPDGWPALPPSTLDEAVLEQTAAYLGVTGGLLQVDIDRPVTALDHFAALCHPLSPQLLSLTRSKLRLAVERSAPYFECGRARGAEPMTVTFVFCHPADRARWLAQPELFGLPLADPEDCASWKHGRYGITLMQQTLGFSMGASKPFWKWLSSGNRARRLNSVPAHMNREDWPDQRILANRIRDANDCRKLLTAAERIRAVIRVGNEGRLSPLHRDANTLSLFCEASCEQRPASAETIQAQLKRRYFTALLHDLHPDKSGVIDSVCGQLEDEPNAERIARTLVTHGFLREESGLFQVAGTPPLDLAGDFPDLYQLRTSRVNGLLRAEFENALLKNDVLYTQLFCCVLDAWERDQLSRSDVPESVLHKSGELQG